MIQTQSQKASKASTSDQYLAESRVVAQEVVQFLKTIYNATSFPYTLPSHLIQPVSSTPQKETPLLAHSSSDVLTLAGYQWIAITTLVMLTTQHIRDIKDAPGDRLRGRRSAPIVLGDGVCRWSVALPIIACSALCPAFFGLGPVSYVFTLFFGSIVARRTLFLRSLAADKLTWKLWALWTCSLFVLPLIASFETAAVGVNVSMMWEALMHYACPGHDCAEKLNVLAVSGVALTVKGSSMGMIGRAGTHAEGNMTVPGINVEGIVA